MNNNTDITLTQSGIAADSKAVGDVINNIESIIGDTPVSVQLSTALEYMAAKNHTHEDVVTRAEFDALRKEVELLIELVGDSSVAVQISNAIRNIK